MRVMVGVRVMVGDSEAEGVMDGVSVRGRVGEGVIKR